MLWGGSATAQEPPADTPTPLPTKEAPAVEKPKLAVTTAFTEDFEYRYWASDERLPAPFEDERVFSYIEQVNRFTAFVGVGSWQAFAQVDEVSLWANQYEIDGVRFKERELLDPSLETPFPGDSFVNLEKFFLQYEHPVATVTLGDFYAAFGNGIALNLNRNVDIDIDTSIQGAKALFRPGPYDITLLAGQVNRQQVFQDNPNLGLKGDYRHLVAGLEIKRYGLGPFNIGLHGVGYRFATTPGLWGVDEPERAGFDAIVYGGTFEVSAGSIDLLGEVDGFAFPNASNGGNILFDGAESSPGYAAYVAATAYVGKTTWMLEGKRYLGAERVNGLLASELYEIAVGPTLEYERQITEDSSATVNSNDIWGGRLRVDWAIKPAELVPYASIAVFRDLEVSTRAHFNNVPETITHVMVGVEARPKKFSVVANLGARFDDRDGDGGTDDRPDIDRQFHGDIDVKFPFIAGTHADVAAAVEVFKWGVNEPLQQTDYVEMETSVTVVMPGERVFLVWYTDYTDNPLVSSTGNLNDLVYGAGELQWKASDAMTIKAFYGAYKAGIRCSGGQCRLLPGFEGARVSFVANF